jgi:hypothetical protein
MTIDDIDAIELPQHLQDLLETLPETMNRKDGAKLVSDYLFRVSPQTVKAWPLGWSAPNGCAIDKTARYLKYAYRKALQAGPTTARWRRSDPQSEAV